MLWPSGTTSRSVTTADTCHTKNLPLSACSSSSLNKSGYELISAARHLIYVRYYNIYGQGVAHAMLIMPCLKIDYLAHKEQV